MFEQKFEDIEAKFKKITSRHLIRLGKIGTKGDPYNSLMDYCLDKIPDMEKNFKQLKDYNQKTSMNTAASLNQLRKNVSEDLIG